MKTIEYIITNTETNSVWGMRGNIACWVDGWEVANYITYSTGQIAFQALKVIPNMKPSSIAIREVHLSYAIVECTPTGFAMGPMG